MRTLDGPGNGSSFTQCLFFSDSLDWTRFKRGLGLGQFFGSGGLFVDVRIAMLIIASKVIGSLSATGIAVDALIVDKVLTRSVI